MTPLTPTLQQTSLIQFLTAELAVSDKAITFALTRCQREYGPLQMILWRYGFISMEQLQQIFEWLAQSPPSVSSPSISSYKSSRPIMTSYYIESSAPARHWNPFRPAINALKSWLDGIEMQTMVQAQWICQLIPSHCPFQRDIRVGNRTLHIPALCQINPVYEQLVALRLRAATYIAEVGQ